MNDIVRPPLADCHFQSVEHEFVRRWFAIDQPTTYGYRQSSTTAR